MGNGGGSHPQALRQRQAEAEAVCRVGRPGRLAGSERGAHALCAVIVVGGADDALGSGRG